MTADDKYLTGDPAQVARESYMAALSMFITEGMDNATAEKRAAFVEALHRGTLRIVATLPHLIIEFVSVVDGVETPHFFSTDDSPKWITWAEDLVRRYS